MQDISEFGSRLLSILEEFKHDNACALLNTILDLNGDDNDVTRFASSVAELVDLELIEVRMRAHRGENETSADNDFVRALTSNFSDWISCDKNSRYWLLKSETIDRKGIPIIRITKAGLQVAHDVLQARGYMWWQHKK